MPESTHQEHIESAVAVPGHEADHFDFLHLLDHHLGDEVRISLPPIQLGSLTIDPSITKLVLMMWLSGLITVVVFTVVARRIAGGGAPRGAFINMFESLFVFVRDDIVYDLMGKETGRRFAPYFISLFFFILFCNLLGLVPFLSTATGNVAVTGALATLTFILTQANGVRANGLGPYLKTLVPPGVPSALVPIMLPIELIGHFIKPFALTIRLFANMIGGHVVILSLFGLVFLFKSIWVAPVAVGFVVFIDVLELLIAFLQTYVFVLLSILFVNAARHGGH